MLVTITSHESFELPKRGELKTSVRRVVQLVNDGKRWATDPQINSEYHDEATKLSRMLLPAGLLAQLKAKRLLIVADGALQYLPFGACLTSNLKSLISGLGVDEGRSRIHRRGTICFVGPEQVVLRVTTFSSRNI